MSDVTPSSINTAWFRNKLLERRMSQRELGRAIGMDSAAVSLTLRGLRAMTIHEAAAIARLLGVPAEEVLQHAGVSVASQFRLISISGYIDGDGEVHQLEQSDDEVVAHPGSGLPEELIAIECRTSGTVLEFMDGWMLFVPQPRDQVVPEAIGKFSICQISGHISYMATPRHSRMRGRWDIIGPTISQRGIVLHHATPILLIQP